MNLDQERYFARDFVQKLAEAFYSECPSMSPSFLGRLAKHIGADQEKAEYFAKKHRVTYPDRSYAELVPTLRLIANVIDSGKKHAKKT